MRTTQGCVVDIFPLVTFLCHLIFPIKKQKIANGNFISESSIVFVLYYFPYMNIFNMLQKLKEMCTVLSSEAKQFNLSVLNKTKFIILLVHRQNRSSKLSNQCLTFTLESSLWAVHMFILFILICKACHIRIFLCVISRDW